MSYSICRIAKMKSGGVTGIQIHDRREKDVSHTNKDIDWSRTHENITLFERQGTFQRAIKERIKELDLKREVRKDATVMVQAMITSDKAFFDGMTKPEQYEFLKKGYEFIKERYGDENVISATVHMDEKTPHVHINFVPVTDDGRLSAKDLFGPKDLRTLQDDFNRYCRENGYDLQRGDPESKAKHLETAEYKIKTAYKQVEQIEAKLSELKEIDKKTDLKAEKEKFMYDPKEVQAIKEQNQALKLEVIMKERLIKELENTISTTENTLQGANNKLKDNQKSLERLSDLESEYEALNNAIKEVPEAKKTLDLHNSDVKIAYKLGNFMYSAKQSYYNNAKEINQLRTVIEDNKKAITKASSDISTLSNLESKVAIYQKRLVDLETELNQHQGLFKSKERKLITDKISDEKSHLSTLGAPLKEQYKIPPDALIIKNTIKEMYEKGENLKKQNVENTEKIAQIESQIENQIFDYKKAKAIAKVLPQPLQTIANRRDGKISFSYSDKKLFEITKADRENIIQDIVKSNSDSKSNLRYAELIKNYWEQEDITTDQAEQNNKGKRRKIIESEIE